MDALDPSAARLLDMLRAGDAGRAGAQTPDERRQGLRALAELAGDRLPPEVDCETLSCPAKDGARLELRRYMPRDGARDGALLYVHGGGWVAGDLDTHAGLCGTIAQAAGCNVFALHYRRPPEHAFPGPIEDVLAALAWLASEAHELGIEAQRLGLAGDSAGANLAAAAAQDCEAPPLKVLLLICPILELARTAGSRETFSKGFFLSAGHLTEDATAYLQGAALEDTRASPLLASALPNAGSVLVHAAACDPFRDEALDYAARLRAAGVPVEASVHPGMIHYFYALPRAIPYARTALAQMGAQVRAALRAS